MRTRRRHREPTTTLFAYSKAGHGLPKSIASEAVRRPAAGQYSDWDTDYLSGISKPEGQPLIEATFHRQVSTRALPCTYRSRTAKSASIKWAAGLAERRLVFGLLPSFLAVSSASLLSHGYFHSRENTTRPPTTVFNTCVLRISSGGIVVMSRSSRTKSASMPVLSLPLMSSSKDAYAASTV